MYDELKAYIQGEILPRYEAYDPAHRRDHIEGVIARSLELATHYEVERAMVYTVAAYHDLGLCEGRETHHLTSGRMLREDGELRRWFSQEQIATMSEAVEDHRASASHPPRTIYGMIVAEADRQIIPEVVIRRSIQYGLSHYPSLTREGHWERFLSHLHEKYDYGGYLQLHIPESENGRQLERLRGLIGRPAELRAIFEQLFEEIAANYLTL